MSIELFPGDVIQTGCYAGAMADYEIDEAVMYLAAGRALSDEKEPLLVGVGEHNVCSDFRSVLAHEIGHLIMPAVEVLLNHKFAITYDTQPKEYWQEKVSRYAGKDDHELFGEAFAAWTHPDYREHDLPKILEDMFIAVDIQPGVIRKAKQKAKDDKRKRPLVDIVAANGELVSASRISEMLDVVEGADWFTIIGDLTPAMQAAFKDAGYEELATAGTSTDAGMKDVVAEDAEQYASEHGAELVSDLQDTTRDRLQGTIEDAVREGWGKDELAEEIENSFAFGEYRSELIASNELALAYSKGRVSAAEEAGVQYKRSLLSADHDDNENCGCSEAADVGVIPFDDLFVDGDDDYDFAPYHVNCQCDWAGIYPGDDEYPEPGDDGFDDTDSPDAEFDDEEHGKFAKSDEFDGILPDYIEEEPQDQTDEDDMAMQLSSEALKLVPVDDNNGQRISGRAHSATRNSAANNFETTSRVANHQRACDLHRIAAKHYETDTPNAACANAHHVVAEKHQEIINRAIASKLAKAAIDAAAHEAAPHEASEAQLHAGNYKMGHINVGGIDISIENPVGSRRRAGWTTLKAHYGYIKRTEGADGDHTDCFVKPGTDDSYAGPVYVIDQYIDGKFDEHKCMIGYASKQEAVKAYLGSYQAGWKCGPVTRLSWVGFKAWVAEKVHDSPLSLQDHS